MYIMKDREKLPLMHKKIVSLWMKEHEGKPLWYEDKIIGYCTVDYDKNEINCHVDCSIDGVQDIYNENDGVSIGFKKDLSENEE